ncbi:MAG: leucine-rich repeat protein [Bacteroidaceae bacterium]|nr:leucine-rich repeat protein [Bacteroidaceae bacterium]
MKKILFTLLSLLMLCNTVRAKYIGLETDIVIDGLTYDFTKYDNVNESFFSISSPKEGNYEGDIKIPATVIYKGVTYEVRRISSYCFCYDKKVTSVTIPNTVTEIGINAFLGCYGLKTLTIPASVTKVDKAAFGGCTLRSLNIEGKWSNYTDALMQLNTSSIVCANASELSKIRSAFKGTVAELGFDPEPCVDGIDYILVQGNNYTASAGTFTATVRSKKTGRYSGDIAIPESINVNGKSYYVTAIAQSAFSRCEELRSVTMSDKVNAIGASAFAFCLSLEKVHLSNTIIEIPGSAFERCEKLIQVDMPASLTKISSFAFSGCRCLEKIDIPERVSSIDTRAFDQCLTLTELNVAANNRYYTFEGESLYNKEKSTLIMRLPGYSGRDFVVPEGVKTIGIYALCNQVICHITLPQSLRRIEDFAFYGVGKLEQLELPMHLEHIGHSAFASNYTFVRQIVIPSTVTSMGFGETLFGEQKLESVVFLNYPSKIIRSQTNPYYFLSGLNPGKTTIYAHGSEVELIRAVYAGNVVNIDDQLAMLNGDVKPYLKGFEFDLTYGADDKLQSITIGDQVAQRTDIGHYFVKGLSIDTEYDIIANYKDFSTLITTIKTLCPVIQCDNSMATQTTMSIYGITATQDITAKPDEVGQCYDKSSTELHKADKNGNYTVKDLSPSSSYSFYLYAKYGDDIAYTIFSFRTQALNPTINTIAIGPTTASIRGSYSNGDAKIKRAWFKDHDGEGTNIDFVGLNPETKYEATFYVESEDGRIESQNITFTTRKLMLETLLPKCVTSSNAIVAAKTNMSDLEVNAGFQWRKYDAPTELKSSEAYAGIYDGTMEGYIKNLQSDKYYKVRAFYLSQSGKLYTGEWVTFDPSDFSYFEPTVHTYAATEVTGNTAKVRGYALPGTEDIIKQGIEYWRTGYSGIKSRAITKAPATGTNILYIDGQVMSVIIDGLTPSTQYTYRAFATTASGTVYGEEMTFTTDVPVTIRAISASDDTPVTIIGYYDLRGTLHAIPQRGVNIVRYSDGTTRKMMLR